MAPSLRYRADIDGLRAIAVVVVVGFHAFPDLLPGGFIGVDIFFVVSGFLISSLILGSLGEGRFSVADFYARRIRRIFPALVLVLAAVCGAGWFMLLPDEYRQLGKHVAAGAGFVANLVFWSEAGYFDELAAIKPLLHLWSLGIEEQFYLAWPLVLWLAWKRRPVLLPVTVLTGLASFALNVAWVESNAIAAFYSPLSRLFELSAGSVLAVLAVQGRISDRPRGWAAVAGGIVVLAGLGILNRESLFPGGWALLPVAGSVLIILAGPDAWLNRVVLSRRAMVCLGLISYPLYLWHWTLLAFARIVERGELAATVRAAIVLASVGLAWLTYALVEKPVRFGPPRRGVVGALCALMLAVGVTGYGIYRTDGVPSRPIGDSARRIETQAQWSYWSDPACVKLFGIEPCVANSAHPKVMLLGDSHANHLFPGLALTPPAFELVQAGSCPPFVGVRLRVLRNHDKHPCAATDVVAANERILRLYPQIRTVILVALWRNALTGELINAREKAVWGGVRLVPADGVARGRSNRELALQGLSATIERLQARGLRVILVRDTPDIGSELIEYCKFTPRFNPTDCTMPKKQFLEYRAQEEAWLGGLRAEFPALAVYDPIGALCEGDLCYLMRDGVLLYRDNHHLSVNGSKLVAIDLKRWMASNKLLD